MGCKLNKKSAMTLAEVLFTLGIVGVICAMTIPTLMNSTQNKENEVAYKKMYSNFSGALNQVTQENGGLPYQCYRDSATLILVSSECTTFWGEFLAKFGSPKICVGGLASGCQPDYKNYAAVIASGGSAYTSSSSGLNTTNNKTSYTLSDGSMLFSYNTLLAEYGLFIVDTNGFKNPNKWGYDVFMLEIAKNTNNSMFINQTLWIYEQGGKKGKDILTGN